MESHRERWRKCRLDARDEGEDREDAAEAVHDHKGRRRALADFVEQRHVWR